MTGAVIWSVFFSVISLVLAVLVTSKAHNDFEVAAFLMALIAYHRIMFALSERDEVERALFLRYETWFRRLEAAIIREERHDTLLDAVVAEPLSDIKESIEKQTKARTEGCGSTWLLNWH
jgi:hypothetical protein